ncbi:MAG: cyclic nucleotide-binding domain-containing protein [Betaproteobacteria bacterium]|jgi:hypothetical protein|nr:cyclic nucleotide-binding domain-containing protein [Betaproteobacteria bacterium]NBY07936.1 cyclic nucleotide-binding domain-containing protein [Betaproteobacteria bacterium]
MTEFETITFESGQRIFNAGDNADKLYIIKSGVVELIGGNGQVFAQVGEGQSFGEQAILSGGIRAAGAQAQGQVECDYIEADNANILLKSYSPLLVPIFEALLLQQSMQNALRHG